MSYKCKRTPTKANGTVHQHGATAYPPARITIPDPEDRAVKPTNLAAPSSPDRVPGRRPATLRLIAPPIDGRSEQMRLPYEWEVAPGVPAVPPVPANLHLIGGPDEPDYDPSLPDPRIWVARLARAIAEVSIGARPPGQLTRWVARDELARLARRGTAVARHPSSRAQRGVTRLRTVRAVRVCPVAPGIVETSAVLVGGERAQAIAIRLEAVADRWLATAVQLG
jgi:hypothetical protein